MTTLTDPHQVQAVKLISVTKSVLIGHSRTWTTALLVASGMLGVSCSKDPGFGTKTAPETPAAEAGDTQGVLASETDQGGNKNPNAAADAGAQTQAPGSVDGDLASNSTEKPIAEGDDDGELNADLLQNTRDVNALVIDKKDQPLSSFVCKQTFDLDVLSPDKSVSTEAGKIKWETTNPKVVRIDADGKATVVGFGSVTLIAVGEKADGTKIQDNIPLEIRAPESKITVEAVKAISRVVTASAVSTAGVFSEFVDGTASGRIRLRHPEPNIAIANIESAVNSTDFSKFKFPDITAPAHDPETCSYSVEFTLEFTYLYVPVVTRYDAQQLKISFASDTGRAPFNLNWAATLVPDNITGEQAKIIVNTGTGTQGFSPKPK